MENSCPCCWESCLCLGPCLGAPPDCLTSCAWLPPGWQPQGPHVPTSGGMGGAPASLVVVQEEGGKIAVPGGPIPEGEPGMFWPLWSPQSPVLEKVWEDWVQGDMKSTRHAHWGARMHSRCKGGRPPTTSSTSGLNTRQPASVCFFIWVTPPDHASPTGASAGATGQGWGVSLQHLPWEPSYSWAQEELRNGVLRQ